MSGIDTKAVRALADRLANTIEMMRWPEQLGWEGAKSLRQCADEIDAMKEDAERYRWLRDDVTDAPGQHHADIIYLKHLHGADLDAAIDRARKGTT
jgi:hypothetical protein